MKKMLFVVCLVMLFAMFTMAQSSTPSASSSDQTSGQSSTPPSSSQSQSSSPSMGSQSSGSMSQNDTSAASAGTIEGCIVKSENDYYLQPIAGGSRVKLTSSQDLSAHVGHHVRLQGSSSATNSSGANPSASASSTSGAAPSASASSSGAAQEFAVTKVDMISTSCPASSNPQ